MLDFFANNMAVKFPAALIFGIGLFLIQYGVQMFDNEKRLHPGALFILYWLALSLNVGNGYGPTPELDWIDIAPFCSLVIGAIVFIACLAISKIKAIYESRRNIKL